MDDDSRPSTTRTTGGRRNPDFTVFFRMGRIAKEMELRLQADIACYGLTPGLFHLLVQIVRHDGLTQRDLAERMGQTAANVSILLEKLCAAGLVTRVPSGRANQLSATPLGRSRYDAIVPIHEQMMADALAGLSPDERKELRRLLRKLERA